MNKSPQIPLQEHAEAFRPMLPLAPSRLAELGRRADSPEHAIAILGAASSVGVDPVHFLEALECQLMEPLWFHGSYEQMRQRSERVDLAINAAFGIPSHLL